MPLADLSRGHRLGPYVIEDIIGRGGMGVVYRAMQEHLGRRVALKLIASGYSGEEEFRSRFEREARATASLDHPNVIPIFEAGEIDGHLFIAMRYVAGTNLRRLIADGDGLDPERAIGIIEGVASALDAAHDASLVHRDVKPANILVDLSREDHPYLTDFGLTKVSEDTSGFTRTGRMVGTIDYIAPEQIEGAEVDGRADVYALGCVLYHALTGEVPFQGGEVQKIWQHVNAPVPSLAKRNPAFDFLDPVIERALAKSPDDRYQRASDFARAYRASLRGEQETSVGMPVSATADREGSRRGVSDIEGGGEAEDGSERRRRRPMLALGAIMLVVAGVAAGAYGLNMLSDRDDEPSEPLVLHPFETPSGFEPLAFNALGPAGASRSTYRDEDSKVAGIEFQRGDVLISVELTRSASFPTQPRFGPDAMRNPADEAVNEAGERGLRIEFQGLAGCPEGERCLALAEYIDCAYFAVHGPRSEEGALTAMLGSIEPICH